MSDGIVEIRNLVKSYRRGDQVVERGHAHVHDVDAAEEAVPVAVVGLAALQVIDGNYERMSGVCPWWDQMKAQKTG